MKTLTNLLWCSVLSCLAGATAVAAAASFSAELVEVKGGATHTAPFHFRDGSYRYETAEGGRTLAIVVDAAAGVTRIVDATEKAYLEIPAGDKRAALLDPFAGCRFPFENSTVRTEGAETVQGVACTRRVLAWGGSDFYVAAVADEFGFPLRVEDRLQQRTLELRKVRRGPVDAALFAVPAGFRRMEDEPEPAPDWAAQVPGAPVLGAAFERTLAAGEVVRLRPQAGREIRLRGTNAGRDEATFTVVAFKGGRPTRNPSHSTVTLVAGQDVAMANGAGPAEADDIVVRVAKGRVRIKAEWAASAASGGSGAAVASGTPAADGSRLMLILDSSGSMSETIGGRTKTEMAKEAFNHLVDGLPADLEVGLMAYGHRDRNDCKDIEVLLPVGKVDKAALKAKVAGLNPKGRTPLGAAVRQAAEALDFRQRRATVVLVSDGLETCDADPCAVAAELAMNGRDFKLHVIGFGLAERDQARLRCLADNTGGLFLAAADASSLRDALTQSVAAVQEPPKPAVEDPGTAKLEGPASVAAGAAFDVRWEGPDNRNDFIALAAKGPVDRVPAYAFTSRGNPARLVAAADPGDYELRYVHGHTRKVIARADIRVTAVEATVETPAVVEAAAEFAVKWTGPAYDSDFLSISRRGQPDGAYLSYVYVREDNPLKLRAPGEAGDYEVRYVLGRGGRKLAAAPLTVRPAGASIQVTETTETGARVEVQWQGPGHADDFIAVVRPNQPGSAYLNYARVRDGNPARVYAPAEPGEYEVRYVLGQGSQVLAKALLRVGAATAAVTAPERVPAAGWIDVTWSGPAADGDFLCVSRPEQPPGAYLTYVRVKAGAPVRLRAPGVPGACEVRYVLGRGNKVLASTTVAVDDVSATIEPPPTVKAGQEFEVRWQGPGHSDDFVTIARPEQGPAAYVSYARVRTGAVAKLRAPKEPGTYEIRYVLGVGGRALAKTTITVAP